MGTARGEEGDILTHYKHSLHMQNERIVGHKEMAHNYCSAIKKLKINVGTELNTGQNTNLKAWAILCWG